MSEPNFAISGGQFNALNARKVTQNNHVTHNNIQYTTKEMDVIEHLRNEVSTNAFHNSVGRIDAPKCYPGTREEVMGEIEKWIDAGSPRKHPILWLSGPAGAGKSAIAQSIAERCVKRGVPVASFFFFRTDNTRNNLRPLVATLSYQILCLYPDAKGSISSTIESTPLILSGHSIEDQFRRLVVSPLVAVQSSSTTTTKTSSQPLVIIIDGLDECDIDSKDMPQQALIRVLDNLLILGDSPFIVFIASRPEPHLTMSFNQLGSPMMGLFLDEHYRPAQDIRAFVSSEFKKITTSHHLATQDLRNWPSPGVVDDIVLKSSGQFIYAATIMRFISTSPISPIHSLEIVLGLRPARKNSPFSQIDAIYSYILSRVEDLVAVKDILAAEVLRGSLLKETTLVDIVHPLGYTMDDIPSYLSDLLAIAYYKPAKQVIRFYHASFIDFLCDINRSGQYYIDLGVYSTRVVVDISRESRRRGGFINFALLLALLKHIKSPTSTLTEELSQLPAVVLNNTELMPSHLAQRVKHQTLSLLGYIAAIYHHNHESSYMTLLRLWISHYRVAPLPVMVEDDFNEAGIYNGFEIWNETTNTPSHRSRLKRRLILLTTGLQSSEDTSRSPSSMTDASSSPQSYQSSPRSHRMTPSSESPTAGWPTEDNDADKQPLPLQFYHPPPIPDTRYLLVPPAHKPKPWWRRL